MRRCRGRGINRCTRCQMVLCDDHFNRALEKCLSCIAIEQEAVREEDLGVEDSGRIRWNNEIYYHHHRTERREVDQEVPIEEFVQEDFDAFEDIQHFDRDAELAQAYDS